MKKSQRADAPVGGPGEHEGGVAPVGQQERRSLPPSPIETPTMSAERILVPLALLNLAILALDLLFNVLGAFR